MALVEDDHVVQTLAANRTYIQGLLGTPADTAAQGPESDSREGGDPDRCASCCSEDQPMVRPAGTKA
jgi:hypothetical protein